jgi:hypothetical protein
LSSVTVISVAMSELCRIGDGNRTRTSNLVRVSTLPLRHTDSQAKTGCNELKENSIFC